MGIFFSKDDTGSANPSSQLSIATAGPIATSPQSSSPSSLPSSSPSSLPSSPPSSASTSPLTTQSSKSSTEVESSKLGENSDSLSLESSPQKAELIKNLEGELGYDPDDILSFKKDFANTEWQDTIYGDFCKQIYKLGENKEYITILNNSIISLESEHDKIINKNETLLNNFKTNFKILRELYDKFLENPSKKVKDDMNKIYKKMKDYNIEYNKIYDGIEDTKIKDLVDIDTKIIIQKIKANIFKQLMIK